MPRFEVTTKTIVAFDADSIDAARYLVENGETPRDHDLVAAFISKIERVENVSEESKD